MNFSVNSPILFVLAGVIILAVLAQSVFFLVRAIRRSKEIGMDQQKLRKTMVTAGVFTIAPAVAIVISVITLSKDLGLPLPWLRLSVVGSLSYETIAATNAESAMGLTFGQVSALTASQYVTIAWVMTISIMLGIWLVPLIGKKLQGGMTKIENRDKRWGDILSSALFIGMIALAFSEKSKKTSPLIRFFIISINKSVNISVNNNASGLKRNVCVSFGIIIVQRHTMGFPALTVL